MSVESTPGISTRTIQHPKRNGTEAHSETIFIFDLSKMTIATAFANPRASTIPLPEWTIDQLFRIMLEPKEVDRDRNKKLVEQIEKHRAMFIWNFIAALQGNPLNDEAVRFAARHKPADGPITSFRSTYPDPNNPNKTKNTILHISADVVRWDLVGATARVRDDLFEVRSPSGGLVEYIMELYEQRLVPLEKPIAKNDADVRKALSAMAYVQQINTAMSFAIDISQTDRSKIWSDFFDQSDGVERTAETESLFLRGDKLCEHPLNAPKVAQLRRFCEKQVEPLITELATAAAWARAGETKGVQVCASAKARDDAALDVLNIVRKDKVILRALDEWDQLAWHDQVAVTAFLNRLYSTLARCPGAMKSLAESEFRAVALGACLAAEKLPKFPGTSSREKLLAEALDRFDPRTEFKHLATPMTKAIQGAFARYSKTRKLPAPLASLWAHATPSVLIRFDKLTPDKLNADGTAYLLRSVFGMGLLTPAEMQTVYSELNALLRAAVIHGPTSKKTKRAIEGLFNETVSHGPASFRSNFWTEGRIYNSIKLALGVAGIREGISTAIEDGSLSEEGFLKLSSAILRTTDALNEFRPVIEGIFDASGSAVRHGTAAISKLASVARLSRIGEVISVLLSYQAAANTEEFSTDRDLAIADVATAWLSLMVSVFEGLAGASFPVAGLAIILLRWVLFDKDVWNFIANVTSAPPPATITRRILEKIAAETPTGHAGDIEKLLELAPNWPSIESRIEDMRDHAPESVQKDTEASFALYFNIITEHATPIREYASSAYGIAPEVAEVLIEG